MAISVLRQMRELLNKIEAPELGPGPRSGVSSEAELQAACDAIGLSSGKEPHQLARALVLLWHDQLNTAHHIAQEIGSSDGSYVHAIMHRREPDYGNAKYWFRRVGGHPIFPALAKTASSLIKDYPTLNTLASKGSEWDPFAFVDLCEQHAQSRSIGSAPEVQCLRQIQAAEIHLLLEYLLAS